MLRCTHIQVTHAFARARARAFMLSMIDDARSPHVSIFREASVKPTHRYYSLRVYVMPAMMFCEATTVVAAAHAA